MSRPQPLSGFPELLPRQRIVEQQVVDHLRRAFELHGFANLHTRAVEPMDQLLRKGETSKEVYVLRRLQADAEGGDAGLGLHFDLTVPFARYVLENAGKLNFPFRRYQIQPCWRGERPQEGRYREFLQADIDIVDLGELPAHYEVEVALVIADALRGLPLPPVRMHVNNRKLSQGFYQGLGIHDTDEALRIIDKLDKIGHDAVAKLLIDTVDATPEQAEACLKLASISAEDTSFVEEVRALGVSDPLLDEGLSELAAVVDAAAKEAPGFVVADMKIARGLDYYTGTVYETVMEGYEGLGSICSGGRYDKLASDGKHTYPGVGLSIGVSRILVPLLQAGKIDATREVPTCVIVALADEEDRSAANALAQRLRRRGVPTQVSPSAAKFGKQIKFADKRGIPFVLFTNEEGTQIKDIRSGEQTTVDVDAWEPPAADLHPTIVAE
ncbi:histidine--tRNA ligase [Glycomyces sp. TRM65418]|uniref:histidine--tRNA ligase n=1 Tax=Glycomyces sp. TRM65418 TaxID=2867006 RepID=UPI001CE555B7|nr:histidine--tRNA ligase [Glycomyces sp. TRM65418]MCC3761667.1 histidine--tRNA ligase [Glycomyces sp. TRM65418]QZD55761.1 histidine--tRNA ligase [Glycomyces sp. TRM65418]